MGETIVYRLVVIQVQMPISFFLAAANEVGEEQNGNPMMLLLFLAGVIILFIWVVWFASFLNKFQRELKHLNNRIDQSINERERLHYVRRRRRLWLSLIPFVKYHRHSRKHHHRHHHHHDEE